MGQQRDKIGSVIRGDHQILGVCKGRFGVVYICRQNLPDGNHIYKAIKTFRHTEDTITRQLFDRELANWVRLPPHPNVVQAKDADTVNKLLVLEFVPGPNLKAVASRTPIHPEHVLLWARQIAAGLRFLHVENHFVHRDLRPANILIDITRNLTAKISDLGIGKPFDPQSTSHTIIGTYIFMAPEVHESQTDYRSDIFSYGATLYFLLTGQYAIRRTTKEMGDVVPPSHYVPVSSEVERLVLKCLTVKRDDRFQSMDEIVTALEPIRPWSVDALPFRHCSTHEYSYFLHSEKTRCPFCAFMEYFHHQEEKLKRQPPQKSDA